MGSSFNRSEGSLAPIVLLVVILFAFLGAGMWWLSTQETGHPLVSQEQDTRSRLATPIKTAESKSKAAY